MEVNGVEINERSYRYNPNEHSGVSRSELDVERATSDSPVLVEPRKYAKFSETQPQPDYMSWSRGSLFICFVWGVLAYIASIKTQKYNRMEAYDQAAYFSRAALRLNRSALACAIVLVCILGVPLAIALAVQGDASKYPYARTFFG